MGNSQKRKILVVAAHPDDEVLGCGGTMAKLAREGNEIYTLMMGEGVTARDEKRDRGLREKELNELKNQVESANKILGVKEIFIHSLPDNRFDSVDLLDVIKKIEEVKNKIKPDIVFTHYGKDLNIDHQVLYDAVLAATRPVGGETVKEVYSFEVLSSTEWNYPLSFSPDVYFEISDTLELKFKAMAVYKSELKDFPHPRSLEGIKLSAQYWGMRVGQKHVEAFKAVRVLR